MPPTLGHGKLCYLEIPSVDIERAAAFYHSVFGWRIRRTAGGRVAFDDGVGEVSGAWVTGRPSSSEAGLLLYIMVDDVAACVQTVMARGGQIVQPIGADAPELTARFHDLDGNVIGLYQEPGRAAAASSPE